jgi:hypothetical protein
MISLFIVLIIGLHVLPLIQEYTGKRQTFWPIMAWGMYRNSRPANVKISVKKVQISAKTETGSILDITSIHHPPFFNLLRNTYKKDENRIPLGHYAYQRVFVNPMLQGDKNAARKLATLLNRNRQDRVTHIQIQTERYDMSDAGIEKVDSPIIAYDVSP